MMERIVSHLFIETTGKIMAADDSSQLADIARVIKSLRNERQIREFLYALLTPRERERLVGRWDLVCLLAAGISQREISRRLGMSLCKITRGSRELRRGDAAFRKIVRQLMRTNKRVGK